jgi:hypothetical protein
MANLNGRGKKQQRRVEHSDGADIDDNDGAAHVHAPAAPLATETITDADLDIIYASIARWSRLIRRSYLDLKDVEHEVITALLEARQGRHTIPPRRLRPWADQCVVRLLRKHHRGVAVPVRARTDVRVESHDDND